MKYAIISTEKGDMKAELYENETPITVANFVKLANEAGGHDNITVELIQITSSPHTQSQFISFNPASTKRTIPPTPTDRNKRTHTNHSSRIKKVALWFSAIVVFIVVCLLLISIVSYRSIKNQEENLRKQIYKTEQTIKEKRQQKEDIVKAFDEAQKQLKQMNMNTETSSASKTKEQEINLLEDNIKNIEEELDSLSKKQKNYQQELDKITKKSN